MCLSVSSFGRCQLFVTRFDAAFVTDLQVPEVFLSDSFTGSDFTGGPMSEHLTSGNHIASIDNLQNLTCCMVGNQDRDPFGLQIPNRLLNSLNRDRIDGSKRLIQHDDLGAGEQASRDFQTASFA